LLIAIAQSKNPNRRKCNHKCLFFRMSNNVSKQGKGRRRMKDVKKCEPDHRDRHQFPDGRREREDQIYLSASFTPIGQ
uniref:GCM domain-containing protein n=1 Tax=Brugia timori TaxID=42155 RepID=A0A0R3R0I3_9BILA